MSATRNTVPGDIACLPGFYAHANLAWAGIDAMVQISRLGKLKLASHVRLGNRAGFLFFAATVMELTVAKRIAELCVPRIAPASQQGGSIVSTLLIQ